MEFLFEKYIDSGNEKIFLGYKRVIAEDSSQAMQKALEKEDQSIILCPIANPANF